MVDIAEIWAKADSAWEPLATLFQRIEQDLRIQRQQAVSALRAACEALQVQTDVVGWNPHDLGRHIRFGGWTLHWAIKRPDGSGYCVSAEGWKHVNLQDGTLNGHPVLVLWKDVLHAVAHLRCITTLELPDSKPAPPEDAANDPLACAALDAMKRCAEEHYQATGKPPKREDVAHQASRETRYPVRKCFRLYRNLPDHLRNRGRTPNS